MRAGDVVILRDSEEPVEVRAVLDGAGTLLVAVGGEEFEVPREAVMTQHEKHASCGCC